jgi:hypothetical protein
MSSCSPPLSPSLGGFASGFVLRSICSTVRFRLWESSLRLLTGGVATGDRRCVQGKQQILINALDRSCFFIRELLEILCSGAVREVALVLPQEAHHQVENCVGHLDKYFDALSGLIVLAEVFNFVRKCLAYFRDYPTQTRCRATVRFSLKSGHQIWLLACRPWARRGYPNI